MMVVAAAAAAAAAAAGALLRCGARRFPSFPSNWRNLPGLLARASRDFSNFHYASQRDLPRASGMHNTRNKNDVRINIDLVYTSAV
ncbi:hypothetical protein K0M31_000808 [Melipona bicolor]|uniref:Secreted protein n=1 Tax=Melipona bicolor TaxID=60889 RepID=A0AA40GE86_9HYME|nr:hypothetical protein K0M31_000808 [Melipona bicolor]